MTTQASVTRPKWNGLGESGGGQGHFSVIEFANNAAKHIHVGNWDKSQEVANMMVSANVQPDSFIFFKIIRSIVEAHGNDNGRHRRQIVSDDAEQTLCDRQLEAGRESTGQTGNGANTHKYCRV